MNSWENNKPMQVLQQALQEMFDEGDYEILFADTNKERLITALTETFVGGAKGVKTYLDYNCAAVTVRYPHLTAKDGRGNRREMKDVYVRMILAPDASDGRMMCYAPSLVTKTTFTPMEWDRGFCVPHGGGLDRWGATCWGDGNTPMYKAHDRLLKATKPEHAKAFFVTYKAHLEWENSAGGYSNMRNMNAYENYPKVATPSKITQTQLKLLLAQMDKSMIKEFVRVMIVKNAPKVLPTHELEMFLGAMLQDTPEATCIKIGNTYYEKSKNIVHTSRRGKPEPWMTFKGEKLVPVFEKIMKNEENENICAKPDITEKFCQELTNLMVKNMGRPGKKGKKTDGRSTVRNKPKTAKSDHTPV